jgi:hypothetical protein
MRFANPVTRLALLALCTLIPACSRAVSVGTDPAPVYAVQVRNSLGQDMIVSYDAGNGPAILGTVRANGTERFVITTRNVTNVTITATNQGRTRTSGPYPVQLQAGTTPEVTLR